MYNKLLKVLFILHFLFLFTNAEGNEYDNSQITGDLPSKQNVSACIYETTEHFVLGKASSSARMHLTTTNIFQTILNKLNFLAQI